MTPAETRQRFRDGVTGVTSPLPTKVEVAEAEAELAEAEAVVVRVALRRQ